MNSHIINYTRSRPLDIFVDRFSQLDSVIAEADEETQDQLETLKHTINSSIVGLKDEYLSLDDSLETDPILGEAGTQFSLGDKVMHKGVTGLTISSVDTASGEYQLSNGEMAEENDLSPDVETM